MRYYKKDGQEFIENGPAVLRVTTMDTRPSPIVAGRVMKIVVVNEVVRTSDSNPIRQGAALAMSFPPEHVNGNDYKWFENGRDEECMIPIKFKLMSPGN